MKRKPRTKIFEPLAFVKIGIKSQSEWAKYCKSGKKPKDIPSTLHRTYKEWKGCGDFFGTGNLSSSQISKKYISFENDKKDIEKNKNMFTNVSRLNLVRAEQIRR